MKNFTRFTPPRIMLFALMLVFAFSSAAFADDPYGNFNYGSGTENDPFLISTSDELVMMSDVFRNNPELGTVFPFYAAAYYELTGNIDMSGVNWYPIGEADTKLFLGDFNGAGYTISNLERDTGNGSTGFFGYMGGNLHDLNLLNVNFAGRPGGTYYGIGGAVGGLGYGGVIQNVNVTGKITVGGTYGRNGGGIVGMVWGANARISNSTFDGNIIATSSGVNNLGGIVGFINAPDLVVENCYSAGSITRPGVGDHEVGKIAGNLYTTTFINDTTSMVIDAQALGGDWFGYDGTEVDPALLTKLGVVYNDGAVVVKNAKRLAVATLWFEASGTPSYTGLNNFAVLDEATVGDQYRVTLGYLVSGGEGFTSANAGILKISGVAGVEIKNAKFVSYDENGNAVEVDSNVVKDTTGGVILPPGDDPDPVVNYDLNGDGKVDQLDLAIALKYFTTDDSIADFNKDGTVDIEDFIMLLNHITAW